MNRRMAVIMLVGIAVLGGIFYYLTVNPEVAAEPTPTSSYNAESSILWTIDSTLVNLIRVSDAVKGATFSASLDEASGKWIATQPQEGEADSMTMSTIASTAASLYVSRTITESVDFADFGLTTPDYEIEIGQMDGKVFRAAVGQKAVTGYAYYVLAEGAGNAVLVSSSSLDSILNLAATPPLVTPPPLATPGTTEPLPTLPALGTPPP